MADLPNRDEQEQPKPWENPYSYSVLYHTLRAQKLQEDPTNPMFAPEEVQLRQAQNEYDQRMGRILSLSGDKQVSGLGGKVLNEAMQAARLKQSEHGELNPLTGQFRYNPEYLRQRELERTDRALERATDREANVEASRLRQEDAQAFRQQFEGPLKAAQAEKARADAERARLKAQLEAQGKNVDVSTKKTLEAVGQTWDDLKTIRSEFQTRNYKPPAGGWSDLGTFQDWVVQKNPQLAPKEWVEAREMQGLFKKLATLKQRHEIFGAVLPPGERADWTITEPPRGASKAQLKSWFDKQISLVERALKYSADAAAAGNYNKKQIEGYTRGFYTAPEEPTFGSGVVEPGPQGGGPRYNPQTGEVE